MLVAIWINPYVHVFCSSTGKASMILQQIWNFRSPEKWAYYCRKVPLLLRTLTCHSYITLWSLYFPPHIVCDHFEVNRACKTNSSTSKDGITGFRFHFLGPIMWTCACVCIHACVCVCVWERERERERERLDNHRQIRFVSTIIETTNFTRFNYQVLLKDTTLVTHRGGSAGSYSRCITWPINRNKAMINYLLVLWPRIYLVASLRLWWISKMLGDLRCHPEEVQQESGHVTRMC